jgi:hypothetical protein
MFRAHVVSWANDEGTSVPRLAACSAELAERYGKLESLGPYQLSEAPP